MTPRRRRKSDVASIIVLLGSVVIVGSSSLFVARTAGQVEDAGRYGQTFQEQVNLDTSRRLTNLERLDIGSRLAVLEKAASEAGELRKLLYGVMAGLIGSLLAQIIQIRDAHRRRGGRDS